MRTCDLSLTCLSNEPRTSSPIDPALVRHAELAARSARLSHRLVEVYGEVRPTQSIVLNNSLLNCLLSILLCGIKLLLEQLNLPSEIVVDRLAGLSLFFSMLSIGDLAFKFIYFGITESELVLK